MMKKVLASILIACILFSFCACGAGNATSSSVPAASEPAASSAVETPADNQAVEEAPVEEAEAEEPADPLKISLPLTSEVVDISYFYCWPPFFAGYVDTPDEVFYYAEMERITNIHIDFKAVSVMESADQMNIMFASGDVSDMIHDFERYSAVGIDKAIESGMILDLSDYTEYFPNYLNDAEVLGVSSDIYSDSGAIGVLHTLYDDAGSASKGAIVRSDWLEGIGKTAADIVTFDDWYDMLTAFKTQYNCSDGLIIQNLGYVYGNNLTDGFDTYGLPYDNNKAFYQIDGEVVYGPASDTMKDYVATMAKWYSEGLIYRDYYAEEVATHAAQEPFFDGRSSVTFVTYSDIPEYETGAEGEVTPLAEPVKEAGQQRHLGSYKDGVLIDITGTALSADIDPELIPLALQWLDYGFSEEGSLLANWYKEGESFEYQNGEKVWLDYSDLPEGFPSAALVTKWFLTSEVLVDKDKDYATYSDKVLLAIDTWELSDKSWMYPSFATMNDEESGIYNSKMGDINTYAEESINKFIIGEKSMDEWDEYIAGYETIGLSDAIACMQSALDRYSSR